MGGALQVGCGDDDDDDNGGRDAGDGGGDDAGADGDGDDAGADGDGDDAGDGDQYTLTGEVGPVEGTAAVAECSSTTEGQDEGGCYGFYCGTNSNSLFAALTDDSVCGSTAQVWIICNGDTSEEASRCAREHALDDDPTEGTRTCVRESEALAPVSDACLECYVQSSACARENCLSDCLGGDSAQCDTCREEAGCTPDFYTCAGLPNPQ
jgi:hypothetical protein